MSTLDLKKQDLKAYYQASATQVTILDIPEVAILTIEGTGRPESQSYKDAIPVLFAVSYTIKFTLKKRDSRYDYVVMPLEAQWWTRDNIAWQTATAEDSGWKAMVVQPDFVTEDIVEQARRDVQKKKPELDLSRLSFERFHEGRVAQMLHVGPFSEEQRIVSAIHQYITDQGGKLSGRHHEIYLSDYNRTAPERLRTIIRQPFVLA